MKDTKYMYIYIYIYQVIFYIHIEQNNFLIVVFNCLIFYIKKYILYNLCVKYIYNVIIN